MSVYPQYVETIKAHCEENNLPASFIHVDSLQKAKDLPCVFNNWGLFYKGRFETVNLLTVDQVERLLKK